MSPEERDRFDIELASVLAELPPAVHERLEEVPLVVDDRPSPRQLEQLGVRRSADLCGLYTGIPLSERSVNLPWRLPDTISIFRQGILRSAMDRYGRVSRDELRRQIRITILHEVGHHFGMDEDELTQLGYG